MKSLFLLLVLVCTYSFSQQKQGYATYQFVHPTVNGSVSLNSLLQFTDSTSLFTYYKYGMDDAIKTKQGVSVKDNKEIQVTVSRYDDKGEQVYRDFTNKKITHRITKVTPHKPYIITDAWLTINWVISSETKQIAGYTCQKATGTFRGRTYTAWFTPDIPLPYGPWKLYGLPGLLLEATDADNAIVFTVKSVCYPCELKDNIAEPLEKKIKTMQEHGAFKDYYMENTGKTIQEKLPKGVTFKLQNKTTKKDIKRRRELSPEKIYEWEVPKTSNNTLVIPSGTIKD